MIGAVSRWALGTTARICSLAAGVQDVPRSLLGVAHPVGRSGIGLDSVPSMSEMYDGLQLSVTRDYVDADGYVHLYVVPCRPLYATGGVGGACEHLPSRVGSVGWASFEAAASETGPFYVEEPTGLGVAGADYRLHYSFEFTVDFKGRAWTTTDERRISLPPSGVPPDGADGCRIQSALDSVTGSYYWPEAVVYGGDCDSDTLETVPVHIENVTGGSRDDLVVYVTGGRTAGMDLVQAWDAGQTYDTALRLGRLGLRERLLTLAGGATGTLYVNPDLADENGLVVGGGLQLWICPWCRRLLESAFA